MAVHLDLGGEAPYNTHCACKISVSANLGFVVG